MSIYLMDFYFKLVYLLYEKLQLLDLKYSQSWIPTRG